VRKVTKDEFYDAMGPLNVYPCNSHPDYTTWEMANSRKIVGRTEPGWRLGGDPRFPKVYMLAD
jgi:hypothetical protein